MMQLSAVRRTGCRERERERERGGRLEQSAPLDTFIYLFIMKIVYKVQTKIKYICLFELVDIGNQVHIMI